MLMWDRCFPTTALRTRYYNDWQAHSQLRQINVMMRRTCEWWCHYDVMFVNTTIVSASGYSTSSRRCWKEKESKKTKKIFHRKKLHYPNQPTSPYLPLSLSPCQLWSSDKVTVQSTRAISSGREEANRGNALQSDALWYPGGGPWTRVMLPPPISTHTHLLFTSLSFLLSELSSRTSRRLS